MQRMTPALLALALAACGTNPVADAPTTVERYDLLVRHGTVYDGSGAAPRRVDVAVRGDRIAAPLPPDSEPAADQVPAAGRSAERRVGTECVSTGSSRRSPSHKKKQK